MAAGQIVEVSPLAILNGPVPCPICFDWPNWDNCTICSGSGYVKGNTALGVLRDPNHGLQETEKYFELLGDDDPITRVLHPLLRKEV